MDGHAVGHGTSPRTRGKPISAAAADSYQGNIPAHAGKTRRRRRIPFHHAEHPRARGENFADFQNSINQAGTSPRTRGKPCSWAIFLSALRNIPAHAGKTAFSKVSKSILPEHPRARGENCLCSWSRLAYRGTSPRTRGKHQLVRVAILSVGNIPAHAGKTGYWPASPLFGEEHPRARGENGGRSHQLHRRRRNIPAHAGKTNGIKKYLIRD